MAQTPTLRNLALALAILALAPPSAAAEKPQEAAAYHAPAKDATGQEAEPDLAEDPQPAELQEMPPSTPASPWDAESWAAASDPLKTYICRREHPLAIWCADYLAAKDAQARPAPVEEVDTKAVPDVVWDELRGNTPLAALTPKDLELVRMRATRDGDPGAMEALGYLYTRGLVVRQNYVTGYRWYGRAYLAGAHHVRANMDKIWPMLKQAEKEKLIAEFEAEAPAQPEALTN